MTFNSVLTSLQDIILYSGTPFKIFLSFHAYSEVISFPWCYSADPCPDYVNLLEGGTAMAKVPNCFVLYELRNVSMILLVDNTGVAKF